MSYAVILAHVGEEAYADARLTLAAGLADRFSARLVGLAAEEQRPLYVTDGLVIDGEIADREYQEVVDRLAAKERHFRELVGSTKQPVEWRSAVGNPAAILAAEMRSADLAVLGRDPSSTDTFRALDPAAALLRLGRPALLVPAGVSTLQAKSVVIGWKDSRECRRALQDALPFLHEADAVHVVEICGEPDEEHASGRVDDVVRYLAHHRVKATGEAMRQTKSAAAEALIQFAHDRGADLIVTGAYGHSRFGEWVFGGVTSDLLATSPICCLMSH